MGLVAQWQVNLPGPGIEPMSPALTESHILQHQRSPPSPFFNSDFLGKCSFLLWTLWFSPHLEEVI